MAVVAVYSIKGGVGKTTLAVDLAWRWAALAGRPTLLWDLDPQNGAGFLLGFDDPAVQRAAAVFQREGQFREMIRQTRYRPLDLLQADQSLRALPAQLGRMGHRRRLRTVTSLLKAQYQRIVIDCPAGLNEVSEQVLAAADVVIVPLPASPLSARALEMLRREMTRGGIRHAPILPVLSFYDARRRLHREVAAGIAQGWPILPMASQIEQTAVRRVPLGAFAPQSPAAQAMGRVWQGIDAKLAQLGI
ncbi:MAG: hypothetical protein RIQ99_1267 [Pseudomonadota bacterium]|jgi:cellulose biosynthesis protein BcsQ